MPHEKAVFAKMISLYGFQHKMLPAEYTRTFPCRSLRGLVAEFRSVLIANPNVYKLQVFSI